MAVAVREAQILEPQAEEIGARALEQPLDALDRVNVLEDMRQHRGLVTAAGADLQDFFGNFLFNQCFDHTSDDVRLRNGLAETDRQRSVLVGAARQRLLDEQMPRHRAHGAEHTLLADTLLSQPLHHAHARALRGHANASGIPLLAGCVFHCSNHFLTSGSWALCVRSMSSGVSDTRQWSTAWKSVPGPASAAPPAGPIQYAVSPRGVCSFTTGSALWRRPSRVTPPPPHPAPATSAPLPFSSRGPLTPPPLDALPTL